MESKKINQLATNVNPQTSDLTTIGDPVTGQLKKITWLQVAHLIGAQASLTLQDVTNQGATTTLPITTGGLTLSNLDNGVLKVSGGVVSTYPYGQANGVASLDSGGKVPASQLPSSIMDYKGTWNAATNTPTLVNGTGDTGDVYRCNVAGTVNFGAGNITFKVGDWAIYNGTIWEQSNNSDAVSSVFGRTGDITAQEGDYNIGQLGDVTITSAATNDYLRYNGSSWVNTQFPTFVSSDKLVLQVRNNSGATINKGTVVYINGATAGYPTIAKAQADADATSAQTIGMVQDNISNNSNGVVVIVGQITGVDTSAYTAGTQLYLSGTTAGAVTSTKPYAPIHLVYIGIVTTQNAVNGVIEVKVQNGYEINEIHDISITSVANNDGLFYESSTDLWKNKSIATVLGYTPEQPLTFSSPLVRTTNTISIPAATGSVNGYLTATDWTTFNNKMANPMTTLGDIIFGGTSGNPNRLAGNTTTTKQYLSQTGTGTESASPTWATIAGSDITGAALTKTDDTNVTLTLGGTPATALLRAASLTLGWTGQLSVARGGTGLSALGTEGQLLRVNTGATALEYFTPTYISAAITSLNGLTVATQTFATGTAGTDFAISSASGVHTFNIPVASATKTGKLSSTDWSTFNGKQDALTNPITGDGTETAGNVAYFTGNTSIAGGSSLFFDTAKGLGINVSGTVNSSLDVGITNTSALLIGNTSDAIVSGDIIGNLSFFSRDISTNSKGTIASIRSYATTTYNTGSVSGDLRFYVSDTTQPNGAIISGSEALRINPDRSIRMLSYTTNGILKVSGGDGTIGVAVAGDFPTLNQNTTGSAATLTTARNFTINGTAKSFDGSANVAWTASEIGLTSYLALSGGTMSGQIVLKEGTTSTDYTKGLRFPNDPYGGSGDTSGLRLYADTGVGAEAQVLELYVANDGAGDAQDRINFAAPSNNLVTINGNIVYNSANSNTITSLGTITTGVWNGTAISDSYISSASTWNAKIGGSGNSGYISKFNTGSTLNNSGIYQSGSQILINATAANSPTARLEVHPDTDQEGIHIRMKNSSTYSPFVIRDGSDNYLVQVKQTGEIGLGNPTLDGSTRLQVNGGIKLTGALSGTSATFSSNFYVSGGTNTNVGNGIHAYYESNYAQIQLNGAAAGGSIIDFSTDGTDYKGRIIYVNSTNQFQFYTNATTALTLASTGAATFSGIVGIGVSPITKLHLQGSSPNYILLTNTAADGVANAIQGGIIGQARGYSNNLAQMASILFRNKNGADWYKGEITFNTNNTDGTDPSITPIERVKITSSGDIIAYESMRSYYGFVNYRGGTGRGGLYDYATVSGAGTDYSTSIFSETGQGIYFLVNGSVTKVMSISNTGELLINTVSGVGSSARLSMINGSAQEGIAIKMASGAYSPLAIRDSNNAYVFQFNQNGYASINGGTTSTYRLEVTGDVRATTGFYDTSDIRFKNILNKIDSDNISAIEFTWKDNRTNKKHWGYSAQDVLNILPDAVKGSEETEYTVSYNEVHTWKIAQLEKEIKELKSKFN